MRDKKLHRELYLRNSFLVDSFRAIRELSVTTSWVARLPADVVLRLAGDLTTCQSNLLRLTAPCRLNGEDATSPVAHWNFNDPESSALRLWEVPIECTSTLGEAMPTIILPTKQVLRFLTRASRAAVNVIPQLGGAEFEEARVKLRRLKGWTDIIESLLENGANRSCLLSTKLDLLEEVKGWHEDAGSDGLLLQFLNQAEPPQTRTYRDDADAAEVDTSNTGDETTEDETESSALSFSS